MKKLEDIEGVEDVDEDVEVGSREPGEDVEVVGDVEDVEEGGLEPGDEVVDIEEGGLEPGDDVEHVEEDVEDFN